MEWMSHYKCRETKQQPSMLPGPAVPGCCLVSFCSLCDIHSIHSVLQFRVLNSVGPPCIGLRGHTEVELFTQREEHVGQASGEVAAGVREPVDAHGRLLSVGDRHLDSFFRMGQLGFTGLPAYSDTV